MPELVDYQTNFQHPKYFFKVARLKECQPRTNQYGLPVMVTGNFGAVCQLRKGNERWAVRVFIREAKHRRQHYQIIRLIFDSQRPFSPFDEA